MTEKRSEYRKNQAKKNNKIKEFFQKFITAFQDNAIDDSDNINIVSKENITERRPLEGNGEEYYNSEDTFQNKNSTGNKGLRLKKRLNSAILIVLILIVLVLLALFHL